MPCQPQTAAQRFVGKAGRDDKRHMPRAQRPVEFCVPRRQNGSKLRGNAGTCEMSEIASIAAAIFKRATKAERFVVAIAGPPGSGKSTLAERLHEILPEDKSAVVPMDGFH